MKVPELIQAAREDFLDDTKEPFLWSGEFLCRALNEAERQACRRAYLLYDKTTANDNDGIPLCTLPIIEGTAIYTVSKKILRVDNGIATVNLTYPIVQKTRREMNDWINDWESLTGDPEVFIFDDQAHKLQFCPNPSSTAVAATGTLTSDGTNVSDGDTVTIGSKTYTFRTALTPTEGEVLIGATAAATLDNLEYAIEHGGVPDTSYKCATANSQVTVTTNTDTTLVVTAIVAGITGNSIATTESSSHLAWGSTVLSGGTGGNVTDTATIPVWRLPLADMSLTSKTSTPEIDETYHYDLLDWVAHLAFRKNDSDTINLPLAGMYDQSFTRKFGPLPTIEQEVRRRSSPANPSVRVRAFGF